MYTEDLNICCYLILLYCRSSVCTGGDCMVYPFFQACRGGAGEPRPPGAGRLLRRRRRQVQEHPVSQSRRQVGRPVTHGARQVRRQRRQRRRPRSIERRRKRRRRRRPDVIFLLTSRGGRERGRRRPQQRPFFFVSSERAQPYQTHDQVPYRMASLRVHRSAHHHRQLRRARLGGASAKRRQDNAGAAISKFCIGLLTVEHITSTNRMLSILNRSLKLCF